MLLVAVGMLAGASNAWGDTQTVSLTESVLATLYPKNEVANYFDFVTMAKSWNDAADKTSYQLTAGTTTIKVNNVSQNQVAIPTTMSMIYAQVIGTSGNGYFQWRWDTSKAKYGLFNFGNARTLAIAVTEGQIIVMEGGYTATATGSSAANYAANNGYNTFTATEDGYIAFSASGANIRALAILNPSASAVNYTIKYQDGEGNTLKADATYSGNPGETPTVGTVDKAYITDGGKRYVYDSDDASSQTIASDGSTVVTVVFRLANTYTYSVKAVDGTDKNLFELGSGSYTEGDAAIKIPFSRYYLSGTTLTASGTGTTTYITSFTPNKDDYVYKVTYNSGTVYNVAYYTEGEDVKDITVGANADRASKGQMGYTGGADTYKEVTTLIPGKYIIYMRGQNGNSAARTYNFKVGESVVFTGSFGNGTNVDQNSEEFTVNTTSTLSFACEGSSQSGIDYFYLVKTAVPATTTAGWSTLYTDYALDFSGVDGLTAYTATCDGSKVTLTKVENVPAGTGVVLKGAANTYDIPVIASSATAKGDLKGSTTETKTYDTANNYYYLALNGKEAQFKKLAEGGSIAAGKAYLQLSISGAPSLNIDLGGTTGINAVQGSEFTVNGEYYNLAGQRVAQPTKGLYIVNGKKVVVK